MYSVNSYFPALFHIRCCDTAHGCGVVKPNWLNGSLFLGEQDGVNHWNKKGFQSNLYDERASDRVMLRLNQAPIDIQDFHPETFTKTVDPDVFTLPAYCKVESCSFLSTCNFVQFGKQTDSL